MRGRPMGKTMAEHPLISLLVFGSTPVPEHGRRQARVRPVRDAGRRAIAGAVVGAFEMHVAVIADDDRREI